MALESQPAERDRRTLNMDSKDKTFDSGTGRPGSSEGIGLPAEGSSRPAGGALGARSATSSMSTDQPKEGFGVTGASDLGGALTGSGSATGISGSGKTDADYHECSTCGERHLRGADAQGFDKILSTVGLNDKAIEKMRESLENLDFDSYFTQAREYLGESASRVKTYAKDHKTVIGTALAVVAVGAGVLIAAKRRGNEQWVTPRIEERDINRV